MHSAMIVIIRNLKIRDGSQVLVTIYVDKERPKNRDQLSESDFCPQNVTILCHLKVGIVFSGALCKRSPLPNTLRRFSSRRQQADDLSTTESSDASDISSWLRCRSSSVKRLLNYQQPPILNVAM